MASTSTPCTPGQHPPEAYVPLQASTPPATATRISSSPGVLRPGSTFSFSDRFRLSRLTRNDPPYTGSLPFASRSTASLLGTPSKRTFPSPGPKRQYSVGLGRTGSTSSYTPNRAPSSRILSRLNESNAPYSLPARLRPSTAKRTAQNASSLSRQMDWSEPRADPVVLDAKYPFEESLERTDPLLRDIQNHIRNVVEGDESHDISEDGKQAALGARVLRSIGPLDGWDGESGECTGANPSSDLILRQALRSMVKSREERARVGNTAWSPLQVQKKQTASHPTISIASRPGKPDVTTSRRSSLGRGSTAFRPVNPRTPIRANTLNSLRRKPVPMLPSPPQSLEEPESPTPVIRRQADGSPAILAASVGGTPVRTTISPKAAHGLHRSPAIKAASPVGRPQQRPISGEPRLTEYRRHPNVQSTKPGSAMPRRSDARTPLGAAKQLPVSPSALPVSPVQPSPPLKAPRASRRSSLIPTIWTGENSGRTPQSPLARPQPPFARGLSKADTEGKMLSSPSRPRWR